MELFGKDRSITALWEWLNKGTNYNELNQALSEFKKGAVVFEKRVDYLKKIDKFCTAIDGLKKAKKENAEDHKRDIIKASNDLCDYIEDDAFTKEMNENHDSKLTRAAYSIITTKINCLK